jgi:SAM-dependent methyltransferase
MGRRTGALLGRRTAALLKLGYRCNDACRFCHSAPHRGVDLSTGAARRRIDRVVDAGVERVVFSGGEPTIRPDLVELVDYARGAGLAVGLVSNGRMLAYGGLREALLEAGLSQVYLSLHSHRAGVHDSLVRAEGAHGQTVAAARFFANRPGVELQINCVVTRANLGDLSGLARLVGAMGEAPRTLKMSFVEPEGGALDGFDELVPSLSEAALVVGRTVRELEGRLGRAGLTLAVDGFPACVLAEARTHGSDLWTEGFVYLMEAFERKLHRVDDLNKARGEPCRRCVLDGCPGIYRTYLERRGDGELAPVTEARGSSVDFVQEKAVERFDVRRCPARAGRMAHPDPRRELLVSVGGETRLYRARVGARDFVEWELDRIKNDWQQVYLPECGSDPEGDFADGLRKLRPAAVCGRCDHRGSCGAVWVRCRRDVMGGDERRLRRELSGVRGRVLDVGCGGARYLGGLRGAVSRGEVELHGVDPDPLAGERLAALALRGVAIRHHAVGIEDFVWSGADFDHVLSVRSYSHFRDVDRAAVVVAGLLRPGGRWTLVGDTPLALARSRGAVRRSHADSGLALEHYRNHGPDEAWELLARGPFRLVRKEGVCSERSNLWTLELERR